MRAPSFVVIVVAVVLTACASSQHFKVVKESLVDGEISIDKDDQVARPQAESYMKQRCGKDTYAITNEHRQAGAGTFRGGDSSWRIDYECRKSSAAEADTTPDAGWKP
jgi:hypothetical protein